MAKIMWAIVVALVFYIIFYPGFLLNLPAKKLDGTAARMFFPFKEVTDKSGFIVTMLFFGLIYSIIIANVSGWVADTKIGEGFANKEEKKSMY
jgi:hypothetical protein